MGEIEFGGKPFKKNWPKSMAVKRVQEWLYLNGFGLLERSCQGGRLRQHVGADENCLRCPRVAADVRPDSVPYRGW